jgi:putative peptidoglycan lipid II flippase
LSHPIVELLFQRGEFHAQETVIVASVVQIYAILMLLTASVRVLVPGYYANQNTWWPAVGGVASLITHLLAAPIFMESYGLQGLNYSSVLSLLVNFILVVGGYSFFVVRPRFMPIVLASLRWFPGLILMGVVTTQYGILRELCGDTTLGKLFALTFVLCGSLGVYLICAYLFKATEMQFLRKRFKKK